MKALIYLIYFLILAPLLCSAQTISQFGSESTDELPSNYIKALIWNIHAGQRNDFFYDYSTLAKDRHLLLLQEADLNTSLESTLQEEPLLFTHAQSYTSSISGNKKGIATGSVAKPFISKALRSIVYEFGIATPKVTLIQLYKLSQHPDKLLVVNVHALNFVTSEMFYYHIDQIIKSIKFHKGPAIVAGDFNTWNKNRLEYLDNQLLKLKIKRLEFGQGRSSFPRLGRWFGLEIGGELDQVYTRGLKVKYKKIHSWSSASDHKPIEIHFTVL